MSFERLSDLLMTRTFGRAHEHHRTLPSTNDRAAAWAREGAPHGALVTAQTQTAGRGRAGRQWYSSQPDNIYASLVVRPGPPGPGFGAVGLAVGVGLREGLPATNPPIALKWPNDLLVGGKKLAGILCEARWAGARPELVVGFGINVGAQRFPAELESIATSLWLCADVDVDPVRVLADVLGSLEATLDEFFARGFASISARYAEHCPMLGQIITIVPRPGESRTVVAQRLEPDGALRVAPLSGGESYRVDTADVWLMERPAEDG